LCLRKGKHEKAEKSHKKKASWFVFFFKYSCEIKIEDKDMGRGE
jgi:hypothetical protein